METKHSREINVTPSECKYKMASDLVQDGIRFGRPDLRGFQIPVSHPWTRRILYTHFWLGIKHLPISGEVHRDKEAKINKPGALNHRC